MTKGKTGLQWDIYFLKMGFDGKIVGSVPLDEEIVHSWLEARSPKNRPADGRSLEEIGKEVKETTNWASDIEETESTRTFEEDMKKVSTGFQKHDGKLVVRAGTVRAHVKDCARQLFQAKQVDVPAFRSKVANFVYMQPYWLPIIKNGKPISEPDGVMERPLHVVTPMGPRSALKRMMYVEGAELWCILGLLKNPVVKEEHLHMILLYGGIHGYGGERSLGEGQYDYALVKVDTASKIPDDIFKIEKSIKSKK